MVVLSQDKDIIVYDFTKEYINPILGYIIIIIILLIIFFVFKYVLSWFY